LFLQEKVVYQDIAGMGPGQKIRTVTVIMHRNPCSNKNDKTVHPFLHWYIIRTILFQSQSNTCCHAAIPRVDFGRRGSLAPPLQKFLAIGNR